MQQGLAAEFGVYRKAILDSMVAIEMTLQVAHHRYIANPYMPCTYLVAV